MNIRVQVKVRVRVRVRIRVRFRLEYLELKRIEVFECVDVE